MENIPWSFDEQMWMENTTPWGFDEQMWMDNTTPWGCEVEKQLDPPMSFYINPCNPSTSDCPVLAESLPASYNVEGETTIDNNTTSWGEKTMENITPFTGETTMDNTTSWGEKTMENITHWRSFEGNCPVVAESHNVEESKCLASRVNVRTYKKDTTDPRKGVRWTHEEHRLFLEGLERFGKGAWKKISQQCVKSKTPSQVSSHAQKFYIRNDAAKSKRRKSIHDLDINDQPTASASEDVSVPRMNDLGCINPLNDKGS